MAEDSRRTDDVPSTGPAEDAAGGVTTTSEALEPRPASLRAYLSSGLPAIYHDGDFGVRFVKAFERPLDPIVAVVDAFAAYFDPDLAPDDALKVIAAWFGVEVDESWPIERRRDLVRRAGDLARCRGTRRGLELVLSTSFPELPLRVEDGAELQETAGFEARERERPIGFIVYCDARLDEGERAALARTIEEAKPAHVSYRLEAGDPRKPRST
jgi:phage tail-like protein